MPVLSLSLPTSCKAGTICYCVTPLTSDTVSFPAIALFNLLSFPLAMVRHNQLPTFSLLTMSPFQFASITSSIVQSTVSVNRLAKFLSSPELEADAVQAEEAPVAAGQTVRR